MTRTLVGGGGKGGAEAAGRHAARLFTLTLFSECPAACRPLTVAPILIIKFNYSLENCN